jgi:catechol 2,3-dioxygenase-like lactoylglutathione lyase family enzyme
MFTSMPRWKLIVGDADAAEQFYTTLGMKVVRRLPDTGSVGPKDGTGRSMVRQKQSWISETGDETTPVLILSQFLELEPSPRASFPGEAWLWFRVSDVDETIRLAEANGGSVVVPASNADGFPVRAACIADHEGHHIEIVGPMKAA